MRAPVAAGLGAGIVGRKRNVVIGHTGITWPARPFTGRRGGGPDAAAGGPAAGGAGAPAAPAATGTQQRCCASRGRPARRWPSTAPRSRDERDDLQGRVRARLCRTRVIRLADRGAREPGPARPVRREVQAAARLQLHEHPADRSGPARRDDRGRGQRRQHHEEVRRQDDRHRPERPCRWRQLQLQRAQTEHRHDAQRARQSDHGHRSHRRAPSAHRERPSKRATKRTRRWRPSTRAM